MLSWLFIKSRLVGTLFDEPAKQIRWYSQALQRQRHPELWELYLEDYRLALVLQRLLRPESCGVDVGCHIGSFLTQLIKYAPQGRHIAFEASAIKSRWLKARFPRVEVVPKAVADVTGSAVFEEDTIRAGYSHLRRLDSRVQSHTVAYEVQTCRLDDFLLARDRCDFIKLDIEGGELAALRGAAGAIDKWRPAIIFECGSEYSLDREGLSRRDIYRFVTTDLGYDILCFSDFLFGKGAMTFDEFRKCGLYPFRAFNFVALPRPSGAGADSAPTDRQF